MIKLTVTVNKLNKRNAIPAALNDKSSVVDVVVKGTEILAEKVTTPLNPDLGDWYKGNDGFYYWGGGVQDNANIVNDAIDVKAPAAITFDYNALLSKINTNWNNKPSENVTTVIIDTGVNKGSSTLSSFSEIDLTDLTSKDKDHGTFICSILTTIDDKIIGAKQNASILSIRYKDENTEMEAMLSNLKKALEEVFKLKSSNPKNIYILNISQGFNANQISNFKSQCDEITVLLNKLSLLKVLIFCAAGENNQLLNNNLLFPASVPSTISVGCINEANAGIAFSTSIRIVTPIYKFSSLDTNHNITEDIGSSFCTAFITSIGVSVLSNSSKELSTNDFLNEVSHFSTPISNFDFNTFSSFQFTANK